MSGVLRGYDPFMNIVLDDALEEVSLAEKHNIGMIVIDFFYFLFFYSFHDWKISPFFHSLKKKKKKKKKGSERKQYHHVRMFGQALALSLALSLAIALASLSFNFVKFINLLEKKKKKKEEKKRKRKRKSRAGNSRK